MPRSSSPDRPSRPTGPPRRPTAPLGSHVGRWEILRLLGRGGIADVYLVRAGEDAPTRALKWLRTGGPTSAVRFRREVDVLATLDHPGIPRLHDSGEQGGHPYFVMDAVEGPDLARYAETLRRRSPKERTVRVRAIGVALCELLGHLHSRGIVHRDLKPQNVLLDGAGRPRLIDFGVCLGGDPAWVRPEPVASAPTLLGTPAVASPEQLGSGAVGAAADQYGLGCTLYVLLTGQRVYADLAGVELLEAHLGSPPVPPSRLDPTIPPALEAVVLRLLAKHPADRFPDVTSAARALSEVPTVGLAVAGRQPQIDAVAGLIREIRGPVVLHLRGAPGSGRRWLASLARDAADRAGIAWVDARTASAAKEAREEADGPLLVLCREPAAGAEVVELPPLSLADVRRTVFGLDAGLSGAAGPLAGRAERLWRESGGNPGLLLRAHAAEARGEPMDASPWVRRLGAEARALAGRLAWVPDAAEGELGDERAVGPALEELRAGGVAVREGDRWRLAAEALRGPLREGTPTWTARTVGWDLAEVREAVDGAVGLAVAGASGEAREASAVALARTSSAEPGPARLVALLGRALVLVLEGAPEAMGVSADASAEAHARRSDAGRVAAHALRARAMLDAGCAPGSGEGRARASAATDRLLSVAGLSAPPVLEAWRHALMARAAALREDGRALAAAHQAALRALGGPASPSPELPGLWTDDPAGLGHALVAQDLARAGCSPGGLFTAGELRHPSDPTES